MGWNLWCHLTRKSTGLPGRVIIVVTMRIRMKDIAADLGVSLMTVSKGLRNEPDIGEATRRRIQKRAKELNYLPNVNARSLVTGHSFLVGLIVPDLLHPFFADVARGLSMTLRRQGYFLIVTSSEEDPELEGKEIDQLLGRRLDALVIASVCTNGKAYKRIEASGTPYIFIDRRLPRDSGGGFVGCDDTQIGLLATEHLIEMGCKRIAHIRGPKNSAGNGRLRGYKKALAKHKITIREEYVVNGEMADVDGRRSGAAAAASLLNLKRRPDAIFCFNDPLAVGALWMLLDKGLRIPEDVALIGCGNIHYDPFLRVPLSSIDQHSYQQGERAALLALDLIKSQDREPVRQILFEPTVVIRASSRR
jgi:LacI family transcriptional regulator